ncbi:MAG: hypothetical protein JNJ40_09075 [Bacteroidia bacterium]|nr:hypothetical protein [Bacteroidia bacterium]
MFEYTQHKALISDLPIITDNYLKLLADEYPILYTGTNRYGNRILGSIIEESDDFIVYYFHTIIDDETYYKFIDKKITLREIFKNSNTLFIVTYKGGKLGENNIIAFNEIPSDYLPLENSYCPSGFFIPSLNFGVSLKGKLADKHEVEVPDANDIQTKFADILRNALLSLDDFELNPSCLLVPAKAGSFRINYRIEFKPIQANIFNAEENVIADYLSSLLNYIINKLPNENQKLTEEGMDSQSFMEVEEKFEKIYESSNLGVSSEEDLEKKLVENINDSAIKFEDVVNQIKNSSSFSKIEIINYNSSGGELGLGLIDEQFFESIKTKLIITEPDIKTTQIEEDTVPKTYRIRVYHLNTESGNCWAYFYPDQSENHYKIPIRIRKNDKEYHNSLLSKSLDGKQVINIQGFGERHDGRISSITVDL